MTGGITSFKGLFQKLKCDEFRPANLDEILDYENMSDSDGASNDSEKMEDAENRRRMAKAQFKKLLPRDLKFNEKEEGKYDPTKFVLIDKDFEQYRMVDGKLEKLNEPRTINHENRNDFRLMLTTDT